MAEPIAAALLTLGADADAAAYGAALAADADADAADVLDFAREACPGAGEAALAALAAAVDAARAVGEDAGGAGAAPRAAADASPSALLRALNVHERRARLLAAADDGKGDAKDDHAGPPPPPPASVAALAAAFPSLSPAFLAHALTTSGDDVDAAADWLTETGDAAAAEVRWRAARDAAAAAAAADAEADASARAALVARYGQSAVTSGHAPLPPSAWGGDGGGSRRKGGGGAGGVRYREGVAVSSRGEKYVVVKDREEWDGGSRGKVLLKGKRGKGYV